MSALLGTEEIARMFGLSRKYVTNYVTKRQGFPKPEVNLSRKTRKWRAEDVARFMREPKAF